MSLGPERVTQQVRAEERARRQQTGEASVAPRKAPATKKRKIIPPEMEERQKRALARMADLGIPPLQASIHIPFIVVSKSCM